LRIGHSLGRAKYLQELIALPPDAAEQSQLLEDQRPRNQRKEQQDSQNRAGNPPRLRQNVKNIANEKCG